MLLHSLAVLFRQLCTSTSFCISIALQACIPVAQEINRGKRTNSTCTVMEDKSLVVTLAYGVHTWRSIQDLVLALDGTCSLMLCCTCLLVGMVHLHERVMHSVTMTMVVCLDKK